MRFSSLNIKRILKLLLVNGVTASRVLCAIYLAHTAYKLGIINPKMLGIGILGGLTDVLDGMLAKLLKAKSEFGAFFDKGADKIYICIIAAILYYCSPLWRQGLSWWEKLFDSFTGILVVSLASLEFLLAIAGIALAIMRETRREANIFGKAKMWAECASLLPWTWWLLEDPSGTVFLKNINAINFLLLVAICLAFVSLYCYLADHFKKS